MAELKAKNKTKKSYNKIANMINVGSFSILSGDAIDLAHINETGCLKWRTKKSSGFKSKTSDILIEHINDLLGIEDGVKKMNQATKMRSNGSRDYFQCPHEKPLYIDCECMEWVPGEEDLKLDVSVACEVCSRGVPIDSGKSKKQKTNSIEAKTSFQLAIDATTVAFPTSSKVFSSGTSSFSVASSNPTVNEIKSLMTQIASNEIYGHLDPYSGQPVSVERFLNERVPAITANLAQTFELMRSQILANMTLQKETVDPLFMVETSYEPTTAIQPCEKKVSPSKVQPSPETIVTASNQTPLHLILGLSSQTNIFRTEKSSALNTTNSSTGSSGKAVVKPYPEDMDTVSTTLISTETMSDPPETTYVLSSSYPAYSKLQPETAEILTLKNHVDILDDLNGSQKSSYIEKLSNGKLQITSLEILPPLNMENHSEKKCPKRTNRFVPIAPQKKSRNGKKRQF